MSASFNRLPARPAAAPSTPVDDGSAPPGRAPTPPPREAVFHPSGDNRFRILDATMKRQQYQQDALIEVLHKAQEVFGFLDDDLMLYIAHNLKLPASLVYGVATFYHFFQLKPQGEHTCVVCLGTACYVKGARRLLDAIETEAGVKPGETTPDNQVSLMTARCFGACGIAPVVVFDGVVSGRLTPPQVIEHVKGWLTHESG